MIQHKHQEDEHAKQKQGREKGLNQVRVRVGAALTAALTTQTIQTIHDEGKREVWKPVWSNANTHTQSRKAGWENRCQGERQRGGMWYHWTKR